MVMMKKTLKNIGENVYESLFFRANIIWEDALVKNNRQRNVMPECPSDFPPVCKRSMATSGHF